MSDIVEWLREAAERKMAWDWQVDSPLVRDFKARQQEHAASLNAAADEIESLRAALSTQAGERERVIEEIGSKIDKRFEHYAALAKRHADSDEPDYAKAARYQAMAEESALCLLSIRALASPPTGGEGGRG